MPDEKHILMKYMQNAINELRNATFIPAAMMSNEVRWGIFAIAKSYHLHLRMCSRADWEWWELCESEDSPAVTADTISNLPFFADGFADVVHEYEKSDGNMTYIACNSRLLKYGWLSPLGGFYCRWMGRA